MACCLISISYAKNEQDNPPPFEPTDPSQSIDRYRARDAGATIIVGSMHPVNPPRNSKDDELSEWQKDGIRRFYRYARDRDDRLWIMERFEFRDLEQVYNTANREEATVSKQSEIIGPTSPIHNEAYDPQRLYLREDPETVQFSEQVDRYIAGKLVNGKRKRDEGRFGTVPIEGIALFCDHTETAIMVRARHLRKRQFCKFWEVHKVLAWLGVDEQWLFDHGVNIYNCTDTKRVVRIRLVRSSALMRMIAYPGVRDELLKRGADKFFLLELDEMIEAVKSLPASEVWEPSRWVSHGHICLNPRAGLSFRLFDDGIIDPHMPGRELLLSYLDADADEDELL